MFVSTRGDQKGSYRAYTLSRPVAWDARSHFLDSCYLAQQDFNQGCIFVQIWQHLDPRLEELLGNLVNGYNNTVCWA